MTTHASRPVTKRTQIALGTPTRKRMGKSAVLLSCLALAVVAAVIVIVSGL